MTKKLLVAIPLLISIAVSETAVAVPEFLASWKVRYPESNSSNRNCQLCHYNVNGGDGWNSYGWDIRGIYILGGRVNIDGAFTEAEIFNSDCDPLNCDPSNPSNLTEIMQGLDPGWAPGPVNLIFFEDNTFIENRPPPFTERANEPESCFPVVTQQKRISLVCF